MLQCNPHTTASSLSCLPDTTHDCTSRESHSYRHVQAGFQSMRIEPFLMQNRTHRVAETMPRYPPRISNPLEHLIYTRFAHRFTGIIPSKKHKRILPRHHFELLYDFQRLGREGHQVRPFHLHTLCRYFPHRFFKIKLTPESTSKLAGANSRKDSADERQEQPADFLYNLREL